MNPVVPTAWLIAAAALLGLVVGSFLNVVIYRVPRGQSIVTPPSRCPHCERRLTALDLVPVFSYLVLRGHCRTCRGTIHWRYPVVEAATAVLVAGLWAQFAAFGPWLAFATLGALLIALVLIDLEHLVLPNVLTLSGTAAGLLFAALGWTIPLGFAVTGAVVGFAAVLLVWVLSRGQMGLGDAKLLALLGAFAGPWSALGALLWGSVCGSLATLIAIRAGKAERKAPIPFGPFITIGWLIAFWFNPWDLGRWLG